MNRKGRIALLIVFFSLAWILSINLTSAATNVSLVNDTYWERNLSLVRYSSMALGDIDNDGDLDFALTGCLGGGGANRCNNGAVAEVYINNGSSFNQSGYWQDNLTGVGWSSTSFGDIDNDGDLDLAMVGCTNASDNGANCDGNTIAKIYINNGSSFNQSGYWQDNLTGTFDTNIVLGDINNDGKLDLFQVGRISTNAKIAKVYINNGSSFNQSGYWQDNLTGLDAASYALGDINNDGKLDLALTGENADSTKSTRVHINNGSSLNYSSQWTGDILQIDQSSGIFGDIDNDGDLDYIIMGCCDYLQVGENNGSSFIEKQVNSATEIDLSGIFAGSLAFGDYDNDGYIDFAAAGRENDRSAVYWNNLSKQHNFSRDGVAGKRIEGDGLEYGTLVWGDIDNDGDLDLTTTGSNITFSSYASRAYISNASDVLRNNTKPNPPTINLFSNYSSGILNLSWENATDDETGSMGLYYNLMVGNETKNHTVVSGVFGGSSGGGNGGGPSAGYFGNMMQRKNISLNVSLPDDIYYWYVQTIDTGLAKSNWSEVQSFVVDTTDPTISSVTSSSITSSSATVSWTTDESANSTLNYGTTTSLGSSYNSVSLVTSHSLTLDSLPSSTKYYYEVYSCDAYGNCATSSQSSFTTSAGDTGGGTSSSSSGGGGGGGGSIVTTTPPEIKKFDVDFSKEESGSVEMKEGEFETFSFNGITMHKITLDKIVDSSVRIIIESEPISLVLNIGQSEKIDINKDEIFDFEIELISIISGKAKFSLVKLGGAEIVGERELLSEALFDVMVDIPLLQLRVSPGDTINAEISLVKFEKEGREDVNISYFVRDFEGNEILSLKDTRAVETTISFVKKIILPNDIPYGRYKVVVSVISRGEVVDSEAEFSVVEYKRLWIIAVIGVSIAVLGVIFFLLWRMYREIKKLKKYRRAKRGVKVKSGRSIRVH